MDRTSRSGREGRAFDSHRVRQMEKKEDDMAKKAPCAKATKVKNGACRQKRSSGAIGSAIAKRRKK